MFVNFSIAFVPHFLFFFFNYNDMSLFVQHRMETAVSTALVL